MDEIAMTHWLSVEELINTIKYPYDNSEPVVQGLDDNYYSWMWVFGPYNTFQEAINGCSRYASTL